MLPWRARLRWGFGGFGYRGGLLSWAATQRVRVQVPDPSTIQLLRVLASGHFLTLDELAAVLGEDGSAIRERLDTLNVLGLSLEAVPGRGVRIAGGLDLLDAAKVGAALSNEAGAALAGLNILPFVDSTNAEAQRQLAMGAPCGQIYTAELQSAGRGRRGRAWVSPFASNLYLSLTWEFPGGNEALAGLSLATGVAVVRSLAGLGQGSLGLKWPNDIFYEGAKLGGILLESHGSGGGGCQIIIGIGLNVAMPRSAADDIGQTWTDVRSLAGGDPPDRNSLLAAVLNELLPLVADYEDSGFARWREEWLLLDVARDRPVVLEGPDGRRQQGVARGVDASGALLLETATGMRNLHGGEISLRLQP